MLLWASSASALPHRPGWKASIAVFFFLPFLRLVSTASPGTIKRLACMFSCCLSAAQNITGILSSFFNLSEVPVEWPDASRDEGPPTHTLILTHTLSEFFLCLVSKLWPFLSFWQRRANIDSLSAWCHFSAMRRREKSQDLTGSCTRNTWDLLNARSARPEAALSCVLEAFTLCFSVRFNNIVGTPVDDIKEASSFPPSQTQKNVIYVHFNLRIAWVFSYSFPRLPLGKQFQTNNSTISHYRGWIPQISDKFPRSLCPWLLEKENIWR